MLVNTRQAVAASSDMDRVECLQKVLRELDVEVSYDEAQEIGNSLVEFFETLAQEVDDESDS